MKHGAQGRDEDEATLPDPRIPDMSDDGAASPGAQRRIAPMSIASPSRGRPQAHS